MNSFLLFIISVLIGFCLGIIYSVLGFIKLTLKNNLIITNILNFIYMLFYGLLILMVVINLNLGVFRWFVFVGFVFGTILQQKTLEKIFAKLNFWLYNKLCKGLNFLKNTKFIKKVIK